jgi:hypothetical protein
VRNAIATSRDPESASSKIFFCAFFSRPTPRERPVLYQILQSERRKSVSLSVGSGTAFSPPNE